MKKHMKIEICNVCIKKTLVDDITNHESESCIWGKNKARLEGHISH
jgi:hypothetical protein